MPPIPPCESPAQELIQTLKTKNQNEDENIVLCLSELTLKSFSTFDLDFCILAFHFYTSMKSKSPKNLSTLD